MKSLVPWKNRQTLAAPSLWGGDWFDRPWENPFGSLLTPPSKSFPSRLPAVDVLEGKDEVTVRAEVPGMTEKDIDVTWHDGVLRIRGEKKQEREGKEKGRMYNECSYGYFSRDVPLGAAVDWKGAKAKYKHGVLTVKLPRAARKSVEIKIT